MSIDMHRTLSILTLCLCCGIICGRMFRPDFLTAYCLSLGLLFACWRLQETRRSFVIAACLLALFCGCVLFVVRQVLPADDIQHSLRSLARRTYVELQALVITPPEDKAGTTRFLVETKSLRLSRERFRRCSGKVRVEIKRLLPAQQDDLSVRYGQNVNVAGSIRLDWPLPIMRLESPTQCTIIRRPFSLQGWAYQLKDAVCVALGSRLPKTSAAVVAAMVLGEKKGISPFLYNQMIQTGTVHILVVSGFNVGIICGLVLLFLKVLRVPRVVRFFLAAGLVVLYCLACGASTPVVRATLMAIVCMFSRLVKRQADLLTACAFSASCILVYDPQQLFSPSFQLSYASVLSLVVLFPLVRARLPELKDSPKPVRFTLDAFIVSLSAWMGTSPFIAWYFGMVAPVAVLANIIIPALAALITLCGCLLIAVHYVCPYLASPFVAVTETLVAFLLRANSYFLQLPCSHFFFDKARAL